MVKIQFSKLAKKKLKDIFTFYKEIVSHKVANKIVGSILDSVFKLSAFPEIGKIEIIHEHNNKQFRFIIVSNYKIVYIIKDNLISIITIFDTRQNPIKLNLKD